jgi:polar amino acid transport system substrate-binding protein
MVDLARKSLVEKARQRPDLVMKVLEKAKREGVLAAFEAVRTKLDSPIPLGYSLAGRVLEVGDRAPEFRLGDRVACAGAGYANHAEVNAVPRNLAVHVPASVSDEEAAFVTVAAIGLQGVRLAKPQLGDVVVVIGLGLIGQIAVQLLAAHGCDVVGVDVDPAKAKLAVERGAVAGGVAGVDDVAEIVRARSSAVGADSIVITASSPTNAPLVLAGDVARDRAIVSVVGLLPLEIPRKAFYEKELEVVVSRSYGPGRYDADYEERGRDYPVGYVRWTERRNMQAVLRAIESKRLDVKGLITHRFSFESVLGAYALITGEKPEPHLGVILTYPENRVERSSNVRAPAAVAKNGALRIAVVGTGVFATSVLMPALAKIRDAKMVAAVSGRGLSARHAASKFDIPTVHASLDEVLSRNDVDAVLIATRHELHAAQAAKALRAGKDVFLEKPAAIDAVQLNTLSDAVAESGRRLVVGFNRRFAPMAKELKSFYQERRAGLMMTARINAGRVPSGNWIVDAEEGGGRIIGEACHFVDLMAFWAGARPVGVSAAGIGPQGAYSHLDNVALTVTFADGSVGQLLYTAMGDPSVSKERYEVFCEGKVAVLDNWRSLVKTSGGKSKTTHSLRADKGHHAELAAFVEACRAGAPSPMSLDDIEAVTRATFAAVEDLRAAAPRS